jgi:hypothetical protein
MKPIYMYKYIRPIYRPIAYTIHSDRNAKCEFIYIYIYLTSVDKGVYTSRSDVVFRALCNEDRHYTSTSVMPLSLLRICIHITRRCGVVV